MQRKKLLRPYSSAEPPWSTGAGGLLLAAAAHETGLLSCLAEALPAAPALTHPSGWLPAVRSRTPLLLTLVLMGAVGLHRTRDLRGYTGAALGLLTGRKRAYGYFHLERVLTTIGKRRGSRLIDDRFGEVDCLASFHLLLPSLLLVSTSMG